VNTPSPEQTRWFRQEVQPHESSLRAHLRRRFPSLPDVDDLVQESYCRLIQARKTGPIRYVKAFLFATARNAALDLFRRRRVVAIESVAEIERLPVIEDGPGVADTVGRQQELALLADAIRAVPERCRQVLTLRKLYGISQKEIAAQLGISEHTVEVQVAKGMRRIAASLARHGLP
jgi:RNA polymerase sigma-70 factor (ECF subfamily)